MRRMAEDRALALATGRRGSWTPVGSMVVATTLLGGLVLVGAARGGEPSFDCGKATTWAERAICASETLSAFDREIASLYRDARARASTAGADSLKVRQRSWIGQREQCKGTADPTGCLLTVYQQRRTELTAAVGGEASEGAAGDTSARRRLPTLTADVVWHGDSSRIYQQCQFGDDPCARRVMKAEGASEQALRLAERIDGWADGFQELGSVDVVTAVGTYAANTLEYLFLVNGTPDLIALHEYELTAADRARPDVQQMLRSLPNGFLFSHRFIRREVTPRGSRFVVEADYAQCKACRNEVLARAEIGFDLDADNRLVGSSLIRLTAVRQPRR